MKAVLQRTTKASVSTNGDVIGSISTGLVILLGIEESDTAEDIDWIIKKTCNLRIFDNSEGVMDLSLLDVDGDALAISQFTLQASTKKGNRPSYTKAAKTSISEPLYNRFTTQLAEMIGKASQTGKFGADMQVELINDGPVTILLDSKNKT